MLHLDQEDPEEDGERKLLKPRNMMKGNEGGDIAIVKVSNLIMLWKSSKSKCKKHMEFSKKEVNNKSV